MNIKIYFLFLMLVLSGFWGAVFAQSTPDPINQIVGDTSFFWKYNRFPGPEDGDSLRIAAHLEYVEHQLRNATPGTAPSMRTILLDHLKDYRLAGQYPLNFDRPDRRPCFIDSTGTICAVGYLVEQTAGREAAEAINAQYKYAYVSEMNSPEVATWIEASGFSPTEIAMIQPYYGPAVSYPYFIGNKEQNLQKWFDEKAKYPFAINTITYVEVSFIVNKMGAPQWPVEITGNLSNKQKRAIRREVFKLKFSPYSLEKEIRDFKYTMELVLLPEGVSPGQYSASPIDAFRFNVQQAAPEKQEITLSGTVWDKNYGEPLIGATVQVPGTNRGAVTDFDGKFSFRYSEGSGESLQLLVKYLGYKNIIIVNIPWNDQQLKIEIGEYADMIYSGPHFSSPTVYLRSRK